MTFPASTSDRLVRFQCLTAFLLLVGSLFLLAPASAQKPEDPGIVKFRGAAFPVAEEAGEVTVVVKRLRGSTGEVTVDYETVTGTATENVDYVPTAGTLIWADGDRSDKTFTVEILDDDLDEGQETFGVNLLNPTGDVELSPPSSTVVRIKPSDRVDDGDDEGDDDENVNGTIRLTAIAFPAFEASGEAEVVAERIDGSVGEVTVDFFTVAGSATEPDDYSDTNGTLTWADGELGEKSFLIALVDDEEDESQETITALLTNPTGGAQLGSQDVASVVIIDDDGGEGACIPDATTLCLLDDRFQVTGTWIGEGDVVNDISWQPSTDAAGFGWFFDESNIELLLKVLPACPLNDFFWVFFSATTDVGYTIEVTDLETAAVQVYVNEAGTIATAVTDTEAFACSSP